MNNKDYSKALDEISHQKAKMPYKELVKKYDQLVSVPTEKYKPNEGGMPESVRLSGLIEEIEKEAEKRIKGG